MKSLYVVEIAIKPQKASAFEAFINLNKFTIVEKKLEDPAIDGCGYFGYSAYIYTLHVPFKIWVIKALSEYNWGCGMSFTGINGKDLDKSIFIN